MRKVIDLQMEFWKKDIAYIEFDLQSRDEIPELLTGLQFIYRTTAIPEKVFKFQLPRFYVGNWDGDELAKRISTWQKSLS